MKVGYVCTKNEEGGEPTTGFREIQNGFAVDINGCGARSCITTSKSSAPVIGFKEIHTQLLSSKVFSSSAIQTR